MKPELSFDLGCNLHGMGMMTGMHVQCAGTNAQFYGNLDLFFL